MFGSFDLLPALLWTVQWDVLTPRVHCRFMFILCSLSLIRSFFPFFVEEVWPDWLYLLQWVCPLSGWLSSTELVCRERNLSLLLGWFLLHTNRRQSTFHPMYTVFVSLQTQMMYNQRRPHVVNREVFKRLNATCVSYFHCALDLFCSLQQHLKTLHTFPITQIRL